MKNNENRILLQKLIMRAVARYMWYSGTQWNQWNKQDVVFRTAWWCSSAMHWLRPLELPQCCPSLGLDTTEFPLETRAAVVLIMRRGSALPAAAAA
jgi:hypothetical protein